MKILTVITMILLFVSGAWLIGMDGPATSASDATVLSWTGLILIVVGLAFVPLMSLIDKFKKW